MLGTGYQETEDVKASVDGLHVYVTERTGNLLKVPLATPNRTPAMVLRVEGQDVFHANIDTHQSGKIAELFTAKMTEKRQRPK